MRERKTARVSVTPTMSAARTNGWVRVEGEALSWDAVAALRAGSWLTVGGAAWIAPASRTRAEPNRTGLVAPIESMTSEAIVAKQVATVAQPARFGWGLRWRTPWVMGADYTALTALGKVGGVLSSRVAWPCVERCGCSRLPPAWPCSSESIDRQPAHARAPTLSFAAAPTQAWAWHQSYDLTGRIGGAIAPPTASGESCCDPS